MISSARFNDEVEEDTVETTKTNVTPFRIQRFDLDYLDAVKKKDSVITVIDHLERSFREAMSFRRLTNQPHQFFIGESNAMATEGAPIDQLYAAARDEINNMTKKTETQQANKSRKQAEAQQKLQHVIDKTKEKFKRQDYIVKHGPYFKRHFMSLFGSVIHVSFITKTIMAVIGNKGVLEIWDVRIEENENAANLLHVFHLEKGDVVTVLELDVYDSELERIQQPVVQDPESPRHSTTDEQAESTPTTEEPIRQPTAPHEHVKSVRFFVTFQHGHSAILEIRSVKGKEKEYVDHVISSQKRISGIKINTCSYHPELKLVFAVGCRPGVGYVLSAFNMKLEYVWECSLEDLNDIGQQKKAKSIPFLPAPLTIEEEVFPNNRSIVPSNKCWISHVHVDASDGRILCATTWGGIISLLFDRVTHVIEQEDQPSTSTTTTALFAALLFQVHAVHLSPKPKQPRHKKKQEEEEKEETDNDQDSQEASSGNEDGEGTGIIEDDDDEVVQASECTLYNIKIMSILTLYNLRYRKSQLIVGCSDGTLRSYSMERLVLQSWDKPEQPFLYQWEEIVPWKNPDKIAKHDTNSIMLDAQGSIKVEFATWLQVMTLPDDKTQYLLAMTEEAYVYVFDVNAQAPLMDLRIVATRSMQRQDPRLITLERKKALVAVCRGKEWSFLVGGTTSVIKQDTHDKKSTPFLDSDDSGMTAPSTSHGAGHHHTVASSHTTMKQATSVKVVESAPATTTVPVTQPTVEAVDHSIETKIIEEEEEEAS